MTNTKKMIATEDMQVLSEALQTRWPDVAQDIIGELERALRNKAEPSYLLVKTLCDMTELFRCEAKALSKDLRQMRDQWSAYGDKVEPINKRTREAEFRKIYRAYWISLKAFYPLYRLAMIEAQKPKFPMSISSRPSGDVTSWTAA